MPSFEINIKTTDDPRGMQSATEETIKLTDAMGKLLERAKKKEEYAAAKEAIAGLSNEEREAALAAYKMEAANQGAQNGLTNLERAVAGTRTTLGGLNSDIKVFGQNVGTGADLLNGLGVNIPINPMMLFGQAVKGAGKFVKDSLNDYTAYVEEVDRIATFTGMASDETSRLLQVGDDLRIETKTIEMAMKSMADKGTVPSIQGLMQLSDRYLALETKLERSRFLTDNFSKSGVEMARVMELGGDALKNMTNDVSEYMIITGKSKEEAEAFLLSQDALKDQWAGLGYQMSTALIPVLTDALDLVTKSNDATAEGGAKWMNWVPILGQARRAFLTTKDYLNETTTTVHAQSGEVDQLGNSWNDAAADAENYGRRVNEVLTGGQRGNLSDRHGSIYDPGYIPYTGGSGRANGGPVTAGHIYPINENRPWSGPEYFLAPSDGMIIPAGGGIGTQAGGGTPTVQLVYAPLLSTANEAEVERAFRPIVERINRTLGVSRNG